MPNWVMCDLVVTGPKKELDEFKEFVKGEDDKRIFDFNKVIPYPEEFKQPSINEGFNKGGYEWCCMNWGTKWNSSDSDISSETNEEVIYTFDTAWSPPNPIIHKLGELYPKLNFNLTYTEPSMGFKGELDIKRGKVYNDVSSDYDEADWKEWNSEE
jgi:hypothetical protein